MRELLLLFASSRCTSVELLNLQFTLVTRKYWHLSTAFAHRLVKCTVRVVQLLHCGRCLVLQFGKVLQSVHTDGIANFCAVVVYRFAKLVAEFGKVKKCAHQQ